MEGSILQEVEKKEIPESSFQSSPLPNFERRTGYKNFRIVTAPKRHYWCGMYPSGRRRWYIELTNGRVISDQDDNYHYWLQKCK